MQPRNDSPINLGISSDPQVNDPLLYQALLELHNGLENLLQGLQNYIDRERAVTPVSNASYQVSYLEGLILADATSSAVTITLPPAASVPGLIFTVKHTAGANSVTVQPDGGMIDGSVSTVLTLLESARVISDGINWWII